MSDLKKLPETEFEIMQIIWSNGKAMSAYEIQDHTSKDWKATSILTFLSRLVDKGFISFEKHGRQNYYSALVSEADYKKHVSSKFLKNVFSGSVKNMVASLFDGGALTEDDLNDLRQYLDKYRK